MAADYAVAALAVEDAKAARIRLIRPRRPEYHSFLSGYRAMMREAATWVPAYIGLGSNIDDPVQQLYRALDALRQLPRSHLVAVSGFFRNPPMGPPDQPWFINAAAGLLTRLSAAMLLAELKGIERRHGREPSAELRWGPRVLDLDLLVFGSAQIREGRLVVPHPGIRERNFVLFPLLEIAPGLTIPGLGPIRMLSSALDRTTLEAIGRS